MNDANQKTLQAYEDNFLAYVNETNSVVSGYFKQWIDDMLENYPKTLSIFEIGSATGRDAEYIESKGFHVKYSDATNSAVKYLTERHHNAILFDALKDNFPKKYDLIYAKAILLHFTEQQLLIALQKIKQALNQNGRFIFTVKNGDGEIWSDHKMGLNRYFRFWRQDTLQKVLEKVGLKVIKSELSPEDKWIHIVCEVNYGN